MNDGLILDVLKRMNEHLDRSNRTAMILYDFLQRQEADKVAGMWSPTTVLVNCSTLSNDDGKSFQILRNSPVRKSMNVYNMGPDDCLIDNNPFDGPSIMQQLSDPANPDVVLPAPLQVIATGLLPSGASINIDGSGPLFVYNLASSGALLTVYETLYAARSTGAQHPKPLGWDGLLHQSYIGNGVKAVQ